MAELKNTLKIPKFFHDFYTAECDRFVKVDPPAIVKETSRHYWVSTIDEDDLEEFILRARGMAEDYAYGFCNDNYTASLGKGAVAVVRAYDTQILGKDAAGDNSAN